MIDPMAAIRRDRGMGEEPQWVASKARGVVRPRWRARYYDADGVRRSVYSSQPGRTGQRECAARRDEALVQARQGLTAGLAAQRVDEFLARWLKVKRRDLRPRSFEKYAGSVRRHIDPFIGAVQIGRLRPQRIADLYDDLLDAGRSPANVRYVHSVLHGALAQAVAWRILAVNPADAAKAPRKRTTEITPFTPAEARDLVTGSAGHDLEVLIVLALRTAMRLGELLGLRWADVDAAGRMLNVQRELYRLGGEWLTDAPKSGKHRAISVTDDTIAMLRAYRIDRAQALLAVGHRVTDSDLVFLTDEAEPFDGHHLTERRFKPLLRQLALPARRFHDLRHTAATLMLAGGIHPKVVSEMLGHADVQITLNRYSHVLPTMQAEAAAALEAVTRRAAR